jgi:hypothetical protein
MWRSELMTRLMYRSTQSQPNIFDIQNFVNVKFTQEQYDFANECVLAWDDGVKNEVKNEFSKLLEEKKKSPDVSKYPYISSIVRQFDRLFLPKAAEFDKYRSATRLSESQQVCCICFDDESTLHEFCRHKEAYLICEKCALEIVNNHGEFKCPICREVNENVPFLPLIKSSSVTSETASIHTNDRFQYYYNLIYPFLVYVFVLLSLKVADHLQGRDMNVFTYITPRLSADAYPIMLHVRSLLTTLGVLNFQWLVVQAERLIPES